MSGAVPIRVLLVDDHPMVREGLRAMLQTDPELLVVGEAANGVEARRLIVEAAPAVVLLDIQMPGEDGLHIARWAKTRHPAVKVVVVSNYDEEPLIVEAIAGGASGYLLKDCSRSLLCHTVHAVTDGAVLFKEELLRRAIRRAGQVDREAALSVAALTNRERDILCLIALGKSNRGIAGSLFLSESTVKKRVHAILTTLGVSSRTEAAIKAAASGLLARSESDGSGR
jgi:DNA-binding NarL/FixJ family response regulator